MANINKALAVKQRTDPKTKLPSYYYEFLDVFDYKEANQLLLLRRQGTDYTIKLETVNSKEA